MSCLYPYQVCDSPGLPCMAVIYPQHIVCLWRVVAQIWLNQDISADSQTCVEVLLEYYHILPVPEQSIRKLWTTTDCLPSPSTYHFLILPKRYAQIQLSLKLWPNSNNMLPTM